VRPTSPRTSWRDGVVELQLHLAESCAGSAAILGDEFDAGDLKTGDDRREVLAHGHSDVAFKVGDSGPRHLGIFRELVLRPVDRGAGGSAPSG